MSAASEATAYHEAGHAVLHVALGYPLRDVTITSGVEGKAGHTSGDVLPEPLKKTRNWGAGAIGAGDRKAAIDEVVIYLAGGVVEAKHLGTRYEPSLNRPESSDEEEVVGRIGRLEPADVPAQDALLKQLLERARVLVKDHWREIEQVAAALVEHEKLDEEGVRAAMEVPPSASPQPNRN